MKEEKKITKKRITIVLDDSTDKLARKLQSKLITELAPQSISYSYVVNVLMNKGIGSLNIEQLIRELKKEKK